MDKNHTKNDLCHTPYYPNVYISFLQNVETSPAPLNTPLLLASEYLYPKLLLLLLLKAS